MTEDQLAHRLRAAVDGFETPAFPAAALAGRVTASRRALVRARHPVYAGAFAALPLAIVVAVSTAFAVPNPISDRVLSTLDDVGVHLRGKGLVPLDTREVSLDEARAAADFPVIVPLHVRIVRTLLSTDPGRHRAFVNLVIQDGRGAQIQLDEMRVPVQASRQTQPAYEIDAKGHLTRLDSMRWTLGKTLLMTILRDAPSRAFAERVRRETSAANTSAR